MNNVKNHTHRNLKILNSKREFDVTIFSKLSHDFVTDILVRSFSELPRSWVIFS